MATTHLVEIVHDEDVEDGQARYEPDPVTITAGDSIVWVNRAHMEHTASRHADPGRFSTRFLLPGDTSDPEQIDDVSDAAGFAYGCDIHPGMVGTVVVNALVVAPIIADTEETHQVLIVHDEDAEDGQARYEPDSVTITAGDSIVWVNQAHMEHTASRPEEPGRFESGFLLPGDSSPPQQINDVSDEAGFAYGCAIHPGMVGTVIVRPRTPDTTSEPESDTVSDTDSNLTTTPA